MLGYIGKWAFKSVLMMALMLGVSSYLLYLRTGHTPWSLLGINSWSQAGERVAPDIDVDRLAQKVGLSLQSATSAAKEAAGNLTASGDSAEAVQVYKWVDAQGVTHFSETPPQGVESTLITLGANINVIPSVSAQEQRPNDVRNPVQDTAEMLKQIEQARAEALAGAGE